MGKITVELHHGGSWYRAGYITVQKPENGHKGRSNYDYDLAYAAEYLDTTAAWEAVSVRCPVNFAGYNYDRWPAFLLDIMPTGAGRHALLKRNQITDGLGADWELLHLGSGSPPGNIRIREAVIKHQTAEAPDANGRQYAGAMHPGFTEQDILDRQEYFIEYAYQHGAVTAGASDVQGEAPKYLLVQDRKGRWHAEGAIPDDQVSKHWLVKFPRGKTDRDRKVLKNECAYLEVARELGLSVGEALKHENNSLFIPRFDRRVDVVTGSQTVIRLGMESLCSTAGIAEYGASPNHETLLAALWKSTSEPSANVAEYICRDVINVVLGNKDNHARNTAILKREDGSSVLSPIYDFAPMYLDPEGIARVCRWQKDREVGGSPCWPRIVEYISHQMPACDNDLIKGRLKALYKKLETLSDIMIGCDVDNDIINSRIYAAKENISLLREAANA